MRERKWRHVAEWAARKSALFPVIYQVLYPASHPVIR